jgi:hypothetical protein
MHNRRCFYKSIGCGPAAVDLAPGRSAVKSSWTSLRPNIGPESADHIVSGRPMIGWRRGTPPVPDGLLARVWQSGRRCRRAGSGARQPVWRLERGRECGAYWMFVPRSNSASCLLPQKRFKDQPSSASIARNAATKQSRSSRARPPRDCFAALAMTSERATHAIALTISSHIFLASPNNIIVLSR